MKTASETLTNAVPATDTTQSKSRPHTPGRSDGLGDRLLMFDASTATSLELLRFKTEFSDSLGFEVAMHDVTVGGWSLRLAVEDRRRSRAWAVSAHAPG